MALAVRALFASVIVVTPRPARAGLLNGLPASGRGAAARAHRFVPRRSPTTATGIGSNRVSVFDAIPKPFAFAELVARIRALVRRAQPALPPVMAHGDLRLDPGQRVVYRGEQRLELSTKELAVLELLLAARGGVVSAEELLQRCWDEAADPFSNVVKVTISRLRRKLGEPPIIETVAGAGYRI